MIDKPVKIPLLYSENEGRVQSARNLASNALHRTVGPENAMHNRFGATVANVFSNQPMPS